MSYLTNKNLNADLLDGKHAGNNAGDIPVNNGTLNTNPNADLFDNYHAGNASGNIPVNNGLTNINLNADMVDGHHSTDIVPIGGIIMYAGTPTTDPAPTLTNFLYCDGSAVSRTIYSSLFNVIGTTWGAGDGV